MESRFRVLFSDIGGVLGTNGWDSRLRHKICSLFGLVSEEIDKRHQLLFDSYERGYLTLDQYLQRAFFYAPREFTLDALKQAIFSESVPWPENVALMQRVKKANVLKLGLISNEGQGITEHRVDKFQLRELADFIIVSHCVHMRKPDRQIWQLGLDLAQVSAEECIYVDDRLLFVEVAASFGFTAFQHVDLATTRRKFEELGLAVN